jgi:hypothetical protein
MIKSNLKIISKLNRNEFLDDKLNVKTIYKNISNTNKRKHYSDPHNSIIRDTLDKLDDTRRKNWLTTKNNLTQSITTPFRAVNNAGDLLSRENFSCGGTCQTPQSRPGLHGLSTHFGGVSTSCTPSAAYNSLQLIKDIPAAACNVKFVYDSSDYITYLKQKAINKNYNDLSYGGDQSNSTQSAQRAIRRY